MITDDFLAECDRLAAAVLAPEKLRHPIYFTDSPRADMAGSYVVGFACPGDLLLREHLIAKGKWGGPGPIVCFVQDNPRHKMLGTALHEMAHAIAFKTQTVDRDPTAEERVQYEIDRNEWLADTAKRAEEFMSGDTALPPWFPSHGVNFTRIALHLHARSWKAGWSIGLPEMSIADLEYGLSAPWKYMHALGDEPVRMAEATSAEILATQAPQAFTDLFNRDFKAWMDDRAAKQSTPQETES